MAEAYLVSGTYDTVGEVSLVCLIKTVKWLMV